MRYLLVLFVLLFPSSLFSEEFRLVSKEKETLLKKFLPPTEDGTLKKLYEKHLIFYTEDEMPSAFQHDGHVYASSNNFSAAALYDAYPKQYFGGREPYGNANVEFPWGAPSGLHKSKNFLTFKFVYLPAPVTYWQEVLPIRPDTIRPRVNSYLWKFPIGTTFGEVLLVEDSKGFHETFELRTRTRKEKGWRVHVYRPFPTPEALKEAIQKEYPEWEKNEQLKKLIQHLEKPKDVKSEKISNFHSRKIFSKEAPVDNLPAIPESVVRKLLRKTPFSRVDSPWRTYGGKDAYAPSTEASFHIVPKDYRGSHVEVSSKVCMQCHDTCQMHVSDISMTLEPGTKLGESPNRDWYGLVRGSDNIFSFHIFEKSCINFSQGAAQYPVVLNKKLQEAGLLRRKD